jgi:hypothetical protein
MTPFPQMHSVDSQSLGSKISGRLFSNDIVQCVYSIPPSVTFPTNTLTSVGYKLSEFHDHMNGS